MLNAKNAARRMMKARFTQGVILLGLALGQLYLLPACSLLPNSANTPPTQHAAEWERLVADLNTAITTRDEAGINATTQKMIAWLGPEAGTPEVAPRYYAPIEPETPERDAVWQLWEAFEQRARPDLLWLSVPDGDPAKMSTGLRAACRPIIAFATMAQVQAERQAEYTQLVQAGADYLLALQREDGLFPFPDLRGRHSRFGGMADQLIQDNPTALVAGWIVADNGRGDLQYDHGICGVALLESYQLTGDRRYLQAAQSAADWIRSQPIVINWNYNAFSVWFMARYSRMTGETLYLDEAYARFRLGILPGQLPDGHWFDPHNARLVYHGILMRGILELDLALPAGDPRKAAVRDSLVRALDYAAAEINTHGASTVSTTTEVLSRALLDFDNRPEWETALNININAGLHILDDPQAPDVGFYLADFLSYRHSN